MDKYAVMGNPIAQSKSPQIHAAFAQQTQQLLRYDALLADVDKFAENASKFFESGGKGLNITVPFKVDAYQFADQLSERARLAGAVNTLAKQADGSIYGDNTDGYGLVNDISANLSWDITDKSVLILGAGGAVRGILGPLLKKNPTRVVIANRTVGKAQELARHFKEMGDIRGCSYESLAGNVFELVINGTSASLSEQLPPLPPEILSVDACCYDMMYAARPTVFMRWAASQAAWAVADGLGMLVEQAAESFCIWRGIRPDTQNVINDIRRQMEG